MGKKGKKKQGSVELSADANPIVIRRDLKLGELDAEADRELLSACFVDTGELARLLDVTDPAAIVVGRTGTGKSALLFRLQESSEHSVFLSPTDISIRFLEHSNIIQFLNELGIKLDLFYRILWRHILTVELLKLRYDLRSEADNQNFLQRLYRAIDRDKAKQKAFEYFSEWGDKFWLETDEQLRELTRKFASDVKASLGTEFAGVDISLQGARALSQEQRVEISTRASQVVSGIQIKRLNEVLDLLAAYSFEDRQKKYYLLIDRLDEDWAETETRCRFIRALIEEAKAFRNLKQVKIVAALRRDLLDLVFDRTRDAGFQEEKYEAYLVPVRWATEDLKRLLEMRINEVFRRRYTREGICFDDLFPSPRKGAGVTAIDYLLERTLLRPRDALQFANECFYVASGRNRISWTAIAAAEASYSAKRLKSLKEEWWEFYPALEESVELLRGLLSPFTRSALAGSRLEEVVVSLHDADDKDPCVSAIRKLYSSGPSAIREADVVSILLQCFFHVGIVGIKISSLDTFVWSYIHQPRVSRSEVKRANQIKIHRMLHHVLEVRSTAATISAVC
jgi:hypothetical protein